MFTKTKPTLNRLILWASVTTVVATVSACGSSSNGPIELTDNNPPTNQNPVSETNPDSASENTGGADTGGENVVEGSEGEVDNEGPEGVDNTDNNNPDNSQPITNEPVSGEPVERLPSGGHLSNPGFQWPAVEDATGYRLIIEDHRADRISQQLSATEAGCADTDVCKFTPSVEIHDSILKWRFQSFNSAGEWISTSTDVAYNTLRSLTTQPYTELDNIGAPPNPGNGYPTLEVDQFVVLNNDWGAGAVNSDNWTQTVAVDRLTNGNANIVFEYDWLAQTDGNEYAVKSYPQVIYGNKLGAHVSGTFEELGVPATISDLEEFKIDYRYKETGDAERNLAFESFFHSDCDIRGPNFSVDNREYEMMVWISSPSIRTPGSTKAETSVMIDNQLWDVWIKPEQDKEYIAFTAVNELAQGTLNWNRFIDWTVEWSAINQPVYDIKALDQNWCMAGIEFGVETWWGAAKLTLEELNITRQ